ncbi:TPA: YitT family protein [Streptococcus pyogenes]
MKKRGIDLLLVTIGSFITAIGFNTMFVNNHIASGGMVGIAVVIKALLGMVFWGNSSTGGTGILTQILHKYSPLSLGVAMTIVDGISVLMGFIALSADDVMYSTIGLFVIGYVISVMENGFDSSKNVMIISKDYQAIREYITTVMDRGVTKLPIRGGYTTSDKIMLMAIVSSHELPTLQEKILEIDDTAFIVVMPAAQVMGRGFSLTKQYKREDKDVLLPM